MEHELVIRGGTVIDGTGASRYRADVGIDDGHITTIGRIRGRGASEIDAEGQFVTPGFIDGHTHMDAQVNWDSLGASLCHQGVTSAIMGNCGFSIAPCDEAHKDLVLRSLERAEDIPRKAMLAGISSWDWETFPEYLDVVDRLPKGINYAVHLGHSALRTHVMGERAFDGQATDEEVATMRAELQEALRAGAIGFSTSRSLHMTSDDRPVPSRMASWQELEVLVNSMGELGAGLFQIDHEKHDPGPSRVEYFSRLRGLARESGRPMFFMLVVPDNEPDFWVDRLALLEEAAQQDGRMYAQIHSRELQNLRSFQTILPFDVLPVWSEFRKLPLDEQKRGLIDPTMRAKLADVIDQHADRLVLNAKGRLMSFDATLIIDKAFGPYRSVGDLARERSIAPIEAMFDLAIETDFQQMFGIVNFNRDLNTVLKILKHPRTVVGVSDAGAHVDHISDYSIPAHLLAYWVRTKQEFEWEQAVKMLTSIPANLFGFGDRGALREGLAADVVVFDPETISPGLPSVAYDFPMGATRIKQKATGIGATIVNGEVLMRSGEHTGAHPGKLLRGPLAAK